MENYMQIFGKKSPIRSRVMEAIEQKLSQVENNYEQGCKAADENFNRAVEEARIARENEKLAMENAAVESIVGKLFRL